MKRWRACSASVAIAAVLTGSAAWATQEPPARAAATSQPGSAALALDPIINALRVATEHTPAPKVAQYLDALRAIGPKAQPAAPFLTELLAHDSMLLHNRDRLEALRLRGYLFATLAQIGVPSKAAPLIVDALNDLDAHAVAAQVGGAARAAGAYGPAGRALIPFLLAAKDAPLAEEEFTLEQFDPAAPGPQTTIKLEVIRALGRIDATDHPRVVDVGNRRR